MSLEIHFDKKVVYPNKFKAGDIAVGKYFVKFTDGQVHNPGQEIEVTEDTVDYYNVCHEWYDLKH